MFQLVLDSLSSHNIFPDQLKIDEAPSYQRSNPYIHTGYRANQTWAQCCRSVLQFHNETLNIWTHLLGAIAFLALLLWDWNTSSGRDFVIILTVVGLYQACMLLSAFFHTFNSHSQEASEFCLMLDLGGIACSITASYISGIYYAFWCHPGWQQFYMLTVLGFILVGLLFRNTFNKDENLIPRLIFFTSFVVYGFVPTIHWVFMNGGLGSDEIRLFLPRILTMYLLCFIAFLFYIAKFPEVVLPGRFDILGSSHQWWHIFIFLCLAYWYTTGIALAQFRSSGGCSQGYHILPELKAATEGRFWVTF